MILNEALLSYLPLVDFLADCMGEGTEVVLHDLTTLNQSVVAIRNGHISGRGIGSPITDFSLRIVKEASFQDTPYVANYQGVAKNGHLLKSSTLFIKDDQNHLVGMLCINSDYHDLLAAKDAITQLIAHLNIPNQSAAVSESFMLDVQDLVESNIKRLCPAIEQEAALMNQKEKVELVERLNDMGVFMVKGAVSHVAQWLKVSVPSIYRYLSAVENKHKG